jgi:hypothetical protein
MRHDLIVPQVHVQRQFVVDAMHPERCHVADDTLQRPVDGEPCRQQVRKNPERIAWLLVAIVLGLALDPGNLAALVCIGFGKYNP